MQGRDELAVRRHLRAEMDNLRAAVTWALDRADPEDQEFGVRITVALVYETTQDRSSEYGLWAELALERVTRWPVGASSALLGAAAMMDAHRGEFARALEHGEASLATVVPGAPDP